jgi:hypothetical protein
VLVTIAAEEDDGLGELGSCFLSFFLEEKVEVDEILFPSFEKW